MKPAVTLLPSDVIARHALGRAENPAFVFLGDGDHESTRLNYQELEGRVVQLASGLSQAGLRGRAVLIATPPGPDFVTLFLACLRAGAVAVPVPYPDTSRSLARIGAIVADAKPALIVSDTAGLARFPGRGLLSTVADLASPRATELAAPSPRDVAVVQYTSGSTAAPKGIAITHANLSANLRMIIEGASLDGDCVSVSWLPHFHDMGLIGGICLPLFLGGTSVTLPPTAFVKKPVRWLAAMHRYRANLSGGPCFGYDISARRMGAAASGLDLSAWKIAYCGAEPVRAGILERFAGTLRDAGFDPHAFMPCYGLAEATLMATCPFPGSGVEQVMLAPTHPSGRRSYVACGPAMPGSEIRIRTSSDRWAVDGEPGEICISGDHVSAGIWAGEGLPPQPFAGMIAESDRLFLRTGDIGAMVAGQLVPLDRLKDVVVVYGRKIHAADIEATVMEAAPDMLGCAAFGIEASESERLIVLCEVRRNDMARTDIAPLRQLVAEAHGVVPDIRLVLPGSLVRTSSGKIARYASKAQFLEAAGNPGDEGAAAKTKESKE